MDEYILLKQEINYHMEKLHDISNMMYVSSVAIWVLIHDMNNAFLYLLPLIVIIPSYLNSLRHTLSMYLIASYLKTFLEGKEFNWQRRYDKFMNRANFRIKRVIMVDYSYFLMLAACFGMCFYNLEPADNLNLVKAILFFVILICIATIITSNKKIDTIWDSVKRDEFNQNILK